MLYFSPSFMNTTLDSELVNATTHSCQVYDDAYNNNDPQALAKLFTEDATLVTDTGILHGRDAILKYQTEAFKIIKFSNPVRYLPPLTTFLTARHSSCGALSLVR